MVSNCASIWMDYGDADSASGYVYDVDWVVSILHSGVAAGLMVNCTVGGCPWSDGADY